MEARHRVTGISFNQRLRAFVLLPLGIALFAYAAMRCNTVTFSYDECFTFLQHVIKDRFYQDSFDQMGGNHHLLNVWGMWLSWKLFGDGEFALRLPNLLAYLVFLCASARLAMRASNLVLTVAVFVLLNAHPYVVDFFSLARGYGIAMGWMMLSLWQGHRFMAEGERIRHLLLGTAAAGLAATSHVIMINYLLAWTAAFGLLLLIASARYGWRAHRGQLAIVLFVPLVALAIVLPGALGLQSGGSLNFGCEDPWKCSMRNLAEKVLYHLTYSKAPLVIIEKALWWMLGICAGSTLLVLVARKSRRLRPLLAISLVLVFCLLSMWLQNLLFDVPYPMTRTGVFMVPLCFCVLATALLAWPGKQIPATLIGAACCVPLVINAKDALNLSYAVEWKTTGDLKHLLERIEADHLEVNEARPLVTVCADFEACGSIDYYIRTRHWHWLAHRIRPDGRPFEPSDYYLAEWPGYEFVDTANWSLIAKSKVSALELYRDERARSMMGSVVEHQHVEYSESPDARTMDLPVTVQMVGKGVVATGTVRSLEWSDRNWLALIMQHVRNGAVLHSTDQPSHRQVPEYGQWHAVSVSMRLDNELAVGDTLRFMAIPCFGAPVILTHDLDLWVVE